MRRWSEVYRDDGLVVVGAHTPEFAFEHDVELVEQAMATRRIDHPVAVDNDYAIWTAFGNHYWPAQYFIDRDGVVRDDHAGEGGYERSELVLQRLLGVERDLVAVRGEGVEAEADWQHLRSPETYLGHGRGERMATKHDVAVDEVRAYRPPDRLRTNRWALSGEWTVAAESVRSHGVGDSISYRFLARDAHLVVAPGAGSPIPFHVTLDGEPPGVHHGVDVDEDGNGVLRSGGLVNLVRQVGTVHKRTLEIEFFAPAAEAYVFTFG